MARRIIPLLAVSAFLAAGSPMAAEPPEVDLELVLAVDVSRSMDPDELRLQRNGYVSAFRHPEVIAAIRSAPIGRIAVTYVEWAGPHFQQVVVPWTIVSTRGEAEDFADRLDKEALSREFGTSISGGLLFAAEQFRTSGVTGARRVIDVSGDGPNNMGLPVADIRGGIIAGGITINGLPIVLKLSETISPYSIPNLDIYYEDCVIGGLGAFMITVDELAHFDKAVRRKLVQEIAARPPLLMPAAETQSEPRIDCLIGEKARNFWLDR